MSFQKAFNRELEVAFSKHSQTVWLRIVKYIVLGCVVWLFLGNQHAVVYSACTLCSCYAAAFLVSLQNPRLAKKLWHVEA